MLILSVFPGIDGLGRGFEEIGDCVVRGPDVLWGGDVHAFHPPAGVFDLVIGGPPCQCFSRIAEIARHRGFQIAPNLIPEFERVVSEAKPRGFLMENVYRAPLPKVSSYIVKSTMLNNRWLGEAPEQNRLRRFSFGTPSGLDLCIDDLCVLENPIMEPAALAGSDRAINVKIGVNGKVKTTWQVKREPRKLADSIRLQGFPPDFLEHAPFTAAGKQKVIGNAVPRWMAVAVAKAVHRAMDAHQ